MLVAALLSGCQLLKQVNYYYCKVYYNALKLICHYIFEITQSNLKLEHRNFIICLTVNWHGWCLLIDRRVRQRIE